MSRLFLPVRTNHHINPSFELDANADGLADGISAYGGIINTRVPGRLGGYAQRYQYTGQVGDSNITKYPIIIPATSVGSFLNGDPCAASFYYKLSSSGVTTSWYLQLMDSGGAGVSGQGLTVSVSDTDDWVRSSALKAAFTDAAASFVTAYCVFQNISEGDWFDFIIDDALCEKTPYLFPYFDGTYTANRASWSGTAHASTSVVGVSSNLRFDPTADLFNSAITLAWRYSPLYASGSAPSGYHFQIKRAGAVAPCWDIYQAITSGSIHCYAVDSGGQTSIAKTNPSYLANSLNHAVFRGSTTTLDLNYNGETITQVAHTRVIDSDTSLSIGCSVGGGGAAGLAGGPLLVSPVRKSDAWVTAIQANSGAAYSNLARLKTEFMEPGDKLYVGVEGDNKLWTKGAA